MTDTTAETAEDAAALRTELARFHEGEEPYEDEAVVPTPGQWIWKWNQATPEQRLGQARRIRDLSDQRDRVEALARDWADAPPLLPGQALADLRAALSDDPQPGVCNAVQAGDHLIRVRGDRIPTVDERAAIGALLDANADAYADMVTAFADWQVTSAKELRDHYERVFRWGQIGPALRGPNYPGPEPDPTPLRKLAAEALAKDGPPDEQPHLTEHEYEAIKTGWVAENTGGRAHRIEILDAPKITRCRSWRIRDWRPVRCTRDASRCAENRWHCNDRNGHAWRTR